MDWVNGIRGVIMFAAFHSPSITVWLTPTYLDDKAEPELLYSGTPLIRINWDGEPSGYAENPDNWIFLGK
jgi:hypothetical protein